MCVVYVLLQYTIDPVSGSATDAAAAAGDTPTTRMHANSPATAADTGTAPNTITPDTLNNFRPETHKPIIPPPPTGDITQQGKNIAYRYVMKHSLNCLMGN